jgi:methyl-accepting chemotaxis protein
MAGEPPYPRKQYLVDRGYQLRFTTRVFGIVLAVGSASAVLATLLVWNSTRLPGQAPELTLIVALVSVSTTLLIQLLISIPLVFFLGIRQTHRLVGPMARIKKALEAIGSGDFSPRLTLRQGDALEDLAKTINRMAEQLGQRFGQPPRS